MPLSANILVNAASPPAPPGPPPPAYPPSSQLLVTVQSATAEDMTLRAHRALLDIQERNVEIIASLGSGSALTLSDATLSGGGDGHTFVLGMLFIASSLNLTQSIMSLLLQTTVVFLPENLRFQFALAGDAESLPSLYDPMTSALCAAFDPPPQIAYGVFNLWAGAAKGTRFMIGTSGLAYYPDP